MSSALGHEESNHDGHASKLPLSLTATVVKGFGRGSKMLGIPTANMNMEQIGERIASFPTGIWYCWAFLRGQVFKAVASIGWNPYFKNEKKTVEPHLLHEFPDDFYGEELKLLVCGFIRPEKSFASLDDLVAEIRHDIQVAAEKLDEDCWRHYGTNELEWTTKT